MNNTIFKRMALNLTLSFLIALIGNVASAENLVKNGSFESSNVSSGYKYFNGGCSVENWNGNKTNLAGLCYPGSPWLITQTLPDGSSKAAFIQSGSGGNGDIYQDIDIPYSGRYKFSYCIAYRSTYYSGQTVAVKLGDITITNIVATSATMYRVEHIVEVENPGIQRLSFTGSSSGDKASCIDDVQLELLIPYNVAAVNVKVSPSGIGGTTPGEGIYFFPNGANTATLTAETTVYNADGNARYELVGYDLLDESGNVVSSGTDNSVTINYTEMMTLLWKYVGNYEVLVSAGEGGTVTTNSAWVKHGDVLKVSAVSDKSRPFAGWQGTLDEDQILDNPLLLTVDKPHSIEAKFAKLIYVAQDAAIQNCDGLSWQTAFTNIQEAVNAAENGDSLIFKTGKFVLTDEVLINETKLFLEGGYTGNAYERGGETTIERDVASTKSHRIFKAQSSVVSFASLTIANGANVNSGDSYGQGVALLSDCHAVFTNCTFSNNGCVDNKTVLEFYGGAIGAKGGRVKIYDCVFVGNSIHGGAGNVKPFGGAVFATEATVLVDGCRFDRNYIQLIHATSGGGGALGFVNCPSVVVENTMFTTNYARRSSGMGNYFNGDVTTEGLYGGTIYSSGGSIAIRNVLVQGGWNNSADRDDLDYCYGGVMHFVNSAASLTRSVINEAGYSGYSSGETYNRSTGSISIRGTTMLAITNVLFAQPYSGPLLSNMGGKIEAVSCTFTGVTNRGEPTRPSTAYMQRAGTASFLNCIFYGNVGGEYYSRDGLAPAFTNCLTQSEMPGERNFVADPLFGDLKYCHPQSPAGRYANGWFSGGEWVTTDNAISPAVDAGISALAWSGEPQPNNRRINIGYDGGTEVASKSVLGSEPVVKDGELKIFSYPPKESDAGEVVVSADIAALASGTKAHVTLVYGPKDGGVSNVSDWDCSVAIGEFAPWELISCPINNIDYGEVFYRFVATGENGEVAWSQPVRSFKQPVLPEVVKGLQEISHIYRTSAKLFVELLSAGNANTSVKVIYWPVDDSEAQSIVNLNYGEPVAEGEYSVNLTGLRPGCSYCYRFEAVNKIGSAATEVGQFTTHSEDERLVFNVAPTIAGAGDGIGWQNAGSLEQVLSLDMQAGDEIHLMSGEYKLTRQLEISSFPNLIVRGGYTGNGDERGGESVVLRPYDSSSQHRIFMVTSSKVLFDGVTIENGSYNPPQDSYGQGVALYECDATFTNCTFKKNGLSACTSLFLVCGGAIGAQGGTLRIYDCTFDDNSVHSAAANVKPLGGAVGATGATVIIEGSQFNRNYVQMAHSAQYGGGALGFSNCPSIDIARTLFTTNYSRTGQGTGQYLTDGKITAPCGGTVYAANSVIRICDSVLKGGWNNSSQTSDPRFGRGGTMYFSSGSTAIVERVAFYGCGNSGFVDSSSCAKNSFGSIDVHGAKTLLKLYNVLVADTGFGHVLGNNGGTIDVRNCTFANSSARGILPGCGFVQVSGFTTFRNSIVWGMAGGFEYEGNGGEVDIAYCLNQDGADVENQVICTDPMLYPAGSALEYRPAKGSPCIGAGDPTLWTRDDIDLAGNRRRIGGVDLGCYQSERKGFRVIVR